MSVVSVFGSSELIKRQILGEWHKYLNYTFPLNTEIFFLWLSFLFLYFFYSVFKIKYKLIYYPQNWLIDWFIVNYDRWFIDLSISGINWQTEHVLRGLLGWPSNDDSESNLLHCVPVVSSLANLNEISAVVTFKFNAQATN